VTLECPFCETAIQSAGGECPQCAFTVQADGKGHMEFHRAQDDIYARYESAYEELARDDLDKAVYSMEYQRALAQDTAQCIGPLSGLDLIELGVGQGLLQAQFCGQKPASLISLDISPSYTRNARMQFEAGDHAGLAFETVVGNVEFAPFHACFDVVVATDILEHVLNLGNALARVHRMLRPGGVFWCRVPFAEALGQYSIYNGMPYEFAHLRFFDRPSIERQFREVGLKPIKHYLLGYAPAKFKPWLPTFAGRVVGKVMRQTGQYAGEWYEFSRRASKGWAWPIRMVHQPLELLVGAIKETS
jgi:ubiquinone/menaquinone biosynthesis C-methylase UbiE